MRILVVTNLYPRPAAPAFGTFVKARVDALSRANAHVDVVAVGAGPAHTRILRKYASLVLRLTGFTLAAVGRRARPDVVEAHIAYPTGVLAWPVARLLGARLVLFTHGADVRDIPSSNAWHRRLAGWLYRRADLIVANSRFLAMELDRRFDVPPERVVVISPGIDDRLFRTSDDTALPRTGILFVGRLVPVKGVDLLLDALAGIDAASRPRLTVIGDGPERPTLERHAAVLGVHVEFLGPRAPRAVAEAMRDAAILAVPSVYEEPLGLVALEGLAAGCMVVASAVGGLAEALHGASGAWLVTKPDSESWAAALQAALQVPADEARRRRARGQDVADRHAIDRVVGESLDRYREMLS